MQDAFWFLLAQCEEKGKPGSFQVSLENSKQSV